MVVVVVVEVLELQPTSSESLSPSHLLALGVLVTCGLGAWWLVLVLVLQSQLVVAPCGLTCTVTELEPQAMLHVAGVLEAQTMLHVAVAAAAPPWPAVLRTFAVTSGRALCAAEPALANAGAPNPINAAAADAATSVPAAETLFMLSPSWANWLKGPPAAAEMAWASRACSGAQAPREVPRSS